MIIRLAEKNDLPRIVDIYNQAIKMGNCTADMDTISVESRIDWFDEHIPEKFPIYLAVSKENKDIIMGWCSLSLYRNGRRSLAGVAEITYYLDMKYTGQGIGSRLMEYATLKAQEIGFKHLYALLLDVNIPSIKLLKKYNFTQWGHLPEIADFDGKICGQVIYGKKL